MRIFIFSSIMALLWISPSRADETSQPYVGLTNRDITSLSSDDITELKAGRGWGLALPAELNGYPGPTHVLELAEQLDLSDAQQKQMYDIFEDMQKEAISAGTELIKAERELDQSFIDGTVTVAMLAELTDAAAAARGNLRFIHLSRHLQTIGILNEQQIKRYSMLRGYSSDPCSSVPDGHSAELWRRHNGCEN